MTAPVNLLVIDAEESNRNFLAQLLHKKNYQVRQASSGEEGIRMVREAAPDMVIFDTGLPDLKAMDLIERLEHIPGIANVPCVVLTSHPDPEEMQACLQAGCAEYFVKSGMVMMTLVDAIPRLLTEGRRLRKKREQGYLIVFLSAKGGTGTSSLCANIAMNMAVQTPQAGVAVADLVLPMGTIAPLVGIQDPKINLVSVAGEPDEKINAEYLKSQLPVPPHWLFHLLPGAPDPETSINLNFGHIPNIVHALRQAYDYVLVDLGRSLLRISLPVIQAADLVVLILSTDLSTVNQTKKLWHYLREQEIHPNRLYAIINRAVGLEGLTRTETEKLLEIGINLTIPYMMGNFTLANNQNTPISVKFPTDTATMILKQAAMEMVQKVAKMQA